MTQLSPIGRFDRILLATDGSEFSAGAERVAIAMCAKGKAALTAMTSVMGRSDPDGIGTDHLERAEAAATAVLETVDAAATAAGITCSKVLRFGDDPYMEILAEAEDSNIDAIVVGRRGKRGLARLMLGDATAKVIGGAKCSVMVVPKAAEMWSRRVLLATDGSRSSDAAAIAAAAIAKCCGTPVTVMSVQVPHHTRDRQDEAGPIIDRVVSLLRQDGVDADGMVAQGLPHEAIAAAAAATGADLIVMGSHGRTGLGRLLLGSNSQKVIGEAACPVLVAKGV
ncbi:universal stress protein [Magnetospirillum sp. UT-4]|uniref:universal stress protein n=1 Tax=Magnetospirillum sp. UT-4 TaxID=2681467 RepID=UPI001380DBBC|nr:universal stress protein [Magnetospirillum sp. UT-4]CAA7622461.1 Universal stress protein [Magnetospirillum sp. UT-4]